MIMEYSIKCPHCNELIIINTNEDGSIESRPFCIDGDIDPCILAEHNIKFGRKEEKTGE